jgi:hypothetical protein
VGALLERARRQVRIARHPLGRIDGPLLFEGGEDAPAQTLRDLVAAAARDDPA